MSRPRVVLSMLSGCCALIFAPALQAQSTSAAWVVPNDFDDQKAVMQAQIEIMRKELDLNSTLKSLALSAYQPLPSVLSLSIWGAQAQVRLLFASGASANYKAGDLLPGGIKITEIKEREVLVQVQRQGKSIRVPLEFAMSPGLAPSSAPSALSGPGAIIPAELMPKLPFVPMPSVSNPKAQAPQGTKP